MGEHQPTGSKERLLEEARQASERAYAPYSDYAVGAAVLTPDGSVSVGVNVENASYGASVCAEHVAVCNAVSKGYQEIEAIAIWPSRDVPEARSPPCGICRQVLAEFMEPDGAIYTRGGDYTLAAILPKALQMRQSKDEQST